MLITKYSTTELESKIKRITYFTGVKDKRVNFFKGSKGFILYVEKSGDVKNIVTTTNCPAIDENSLSQLVEDGIYILSGSNDLYEIVSKDGRIVSGKFSVIPPQVVTTEYYLTLVEEDGTIKPFLLDYDVVLYAFVQNLCFNYFILNKDTVPTKLGLELLIRLIFKEYGFENSWEYLVERIATALINGTFNKHYSEITGIPKIEETKVFSLSKLGGRWTNLISKERIGVEIDVDLSEEGIIDAYLLQGSLYIVTNNSKISEGKITYNDLCLELEKKLPHTDFILIYDPKGTMRKK